MSTRFWRLLLLIALVVIPGQQCFAHPMGNFSVNHYSKITFSKANIELQYFIDMAEIPTYQELQQYDFTPADTAGIAKYLGKQGAILQHGLTLRLNGIALPLEIVSRGVIFPPGAGGLPTMKVGYVFRATYPHSQHAEPASLAYADNNYPGHAGWKEIVIAGPSGLLLSSSVPATDRSAGLTNYPTDMLSSPPQDLNATARITLPAELPVANTLHEPSNKMHTAVHTPMPGIVSGIVPGAMPGAMPGLVPSAMSGAVSGAGQAVQTATLSPGVETPRVAHRIPTPAASHAHATAVVTTPHNTSASLRSGLPLQPSTQQPTSLRMAANRQGTARSAFTQLITTNRLSFWFLFTAAFISMGLGALHALEPGHGKTIVAAYLVGSRGTARHAALLGIIVTLSHTASVFALGAVTLYASRYILPEKLYPWLGVLSGLTIAGLGSYILLQRWTGQAMDHSHVSGEMHGHWFSSKKLATAALAAEPNPIPAKTVSLLQLCTLGFTGGIIPCPAALVVLLSAFSLHRVGFGFFLITAFSIGLASVLIGFGLLMVYARRFMSRLQVDGPLTRRWLPVASAAFMTILGAVIAVRAFGTTGITMHSFSQQKLGPALFVAGLGLLLGVRHSTDTDHVVAISTIITKERSVRGAALIGSLWGLGHTLTIFGVGCLIILFGVVIPTRIGLAMEFSVALMLILLGLLNLTGVTQTVKARFVVRKSPPGGVADGRLSATVPVAFPVTAQPAGARLKRHAAFQYLRPLAIGLVHGLAGSAAVALLVLSSIHNPFWAIVYLLIFGAGTMLGMICMTAAMSVPLIYAGDKLPKVSRYLTVSSGLVSVCFGMFLVYQLGFVGGLFTSHPHWTPQ
jgi:ABC-type nickel/cobalt efflux system permease component RcnA